MSESRDEKETPVQAAIVDFGLGNLFSVRQACVTVGLDAVITRDPKTISAAKSVILPGVGAFGDAMERLEDLDLVSVLRRLSEQGKPVMGICLGMQLLLDETEEFGFHEGLGLIEGKVVRLAPDAGESRAKVPHIGWNRVLVPKGAPKDAWSDLPLQGLDDGVFMYFVHSYHVLPDDGGVVVAETEYGGTSFCSALRSGNIFACQFHPERSGKDGLKLFESFAQTVDKP